MRALLRFWSRLRGAFTGVRREAELTEEFESHLQMQVEDNLRLGMPPEEARRAAVMKFGGVEPAKEAYRDQRGLPLLETLTRDVRFGLRALAREPGFTGVCILTLALATGANTAIFSVLNAVLLRPLPYPDAKQLVQIWETNPRANRWGDWASYPDFADWRRENRVFEDVAAFRSGLFRLTSSEYPEMLPGTRVSPNLFSVLRVAPLLGRVFLPEEDVPGRSHVAILSYGLWQRQFGSDPGLLDKTILIDGVSHAIVGVMPPGFTFPATIGGIPRAPDLWLPASADRDRGSHNYRVIARLKPHLTIHQVREDMERLARLTAEIDPGHRERGATAAGLQENAVKQVRPPLLILFGAILLVLLIACANVANLLLARGAARQKEAALRHALGASRTRVLQQWLTESVVLALLGGVAGLLVAFAGVHLFTRLGPNLPLLKDVPIDPRVLAFTLLVSLTTGVAFGVAPAFQALRVDPNEALKEAGTRLAGSRGRSRVRSILTIGEVAIALVLLIGAGLLVRSFVHLQKVDVGFDDARLLTAFLGAPPEASNDPDRSIAFFREVVARLESIPGVVAVAGASAVPLVSNESSPFRVEGADSSDAENAVVYAEQPKVTPGYFRAMGIRMVRGRDFDWADTRASQPVAIVSESLATGHWPGEDAIGKRLSVDDRQWRTVVGVVQDVRHDGLENPARPTVCIPFMQYQRPRLSLLVRTESDPESFIAPIRREVMELDRNQPLFGIQTMEQVLSSSVSLRRFVMTLVGIFAGVALILGVVGVYGVLAYFVTQRRHEIGVRLALGATRIEVMRLILKEGAWLALVGLGIGLPVALGLSRALSRMLFGVSATDPVTFSVMPMMMVLVVLGASLLPARTAARIEPMAALRNE